MARKDTALCLLIALSFQAKAAVAEEYNLPDPPDAMTFETIPYRTVAAPAGKVPQGCDANYRAGMEGAFQKVWKQCQGIGQLAPSDCQRALFDRCTALGADLQKMETQSCTAMLGEQEVIQGFKSVDTQKTAQLSSADLNARANVATRRVIDGLKISSKQLGTHRATGTATLAAGACANSTEQAHFRAAQMVVTNATDGADAHLQKTIQAKEAQAAEFARNSGTSQKNLEQLVTDAPKSVNPSTIQASERPPPTSTVVSMSTTTTTSQPVSVLTVTNTAASPAQPPLYIPPPEETSSSSMSKWVPILAIGIPAAILTAIVVSKMSKNKPGGQPSDSGNGGDGNDNGNGSAGNDGGSHLPSAGNRNPPPSVVPGGGDLAAWKITTDPSFTDQQRATIAAGFSKIPACYRYKLQGLYIQNKVLGKTRDGCVAGMFIFGGNTVFLSPSCTVAIGVTVHELFHVLGNRNNNALHQQWKPVSDANRGCPVTKYGGTNFYEDFAESGRLLEYPDSSLEAKNPGACVDAKISGLGQIMNACPQPQQ